MTRRKREHTSLGGVLKEFIEVNRLTKGLDKVSVKDAWHLVMGDAISKYTTDVSLDGNTLYVRLSSSVLREELSYGKEKIIAMVNSEIGKDLVQKIILR